MNAPPELKGHQDFNSADADPRSDPYAGRKWRQWWLVVVLTFVATLGGIDRQIMSLLIEPIRVDMNLSDTQISVIYGAAFALANVLFLLPAGYLVDRLDRRWLLATGIGIWSLATMACGLATSYLSLFAARAVVGGGESILQPAALSMMRNAVRKQWLGRAYSIYAMAIMLGTALAMAGGGAMIAMLSHSETHMIPLVGEMRPWQVTLLILGLLGIPACLLLLTLREPGRGAQPTEPDAPAAAFAFIVRERAIFIPLLLFNAVAGMLTLSYGAWIAPILIRSWGFSLSLIGTRLGLMMLVLPPLGLLVIGWAIDRFTRKHGAKGAATVGMVAVVALALTSAIVPLMPTRELLWLSLVLAMLTSGTCFPITNTIVAMITPPRYLGRVSAIQYMVYGILGASIGPTIVALIGDNFFTGQHAIGYALSIACIGFGAVALCLLALARPAIARSGLSEKALQSG